VTSRVLTLVLVAAGLWALAAIPARHFAGDESAIHGAVAVLLCLVPGALTLIWAGWTARRDPRQLPLIALGASGVRMFVVAAAACALYLRVPPFRKEMGFLIWVLGAYFALLAVELWLLLGWRQPEAAPDRTPSLTREGEIG
jgi:threonine/homoserine/homoserine lactone efflux protein